MLTSSAVGRALIICEKPSVAGDVAKALFGGKGKKVADRYEGPDAIVAFAVGHLVEQVDPEIAPEHDEEQEAGREQDSLADKLQIKDIGSHWQRRESC